MARRFLSSGLLVVGLLLVGLGAYGYFATPSGPALVVANTDIQMPDLKAGEETEVLISLDNKSSRPIRVVGLAKC